MNNNLSVIIITKDEEKMLPEALESVKWVSELLIIDTGSQDKTVEIAKEAGARVVSSKGNNFAEWRNKGLKEAKGNWILYLDADERITPELKEEIKSLITNHHSPITMYAIPRKNIILGKEFHHGGFWPDYVKRLYLKKSLQKWTGELHEEPVYTGEMSHLINPMLHIKHEDIHEMVEKTNRWSEIEAKLMFEAHHPPMTVPRFLSAMWREFTYRMFSNRGFMDGKEGIIFAMYQVYSRFVSYAKLWELQERERMKKS